MIDLPARGYVPVKPYAVSRTSERSIARIPLNRIRTSPFQPRSFFPETSIAELAQSIRQHGLLTPLLVRRIDADSYELIAGERRLRALMLLERPFAEAIVLSAFDQDCALIALVENLQRENLHYLDEAEAYKNILSDHNITQERLAHSLSLSPSALANRLRLLKLPEDVRSALRETGLTERHARALLKLSDAALQLELVHDADSQHLSVKQLESRIERLLRAAPPRPRIRGIIRDNRLIINTVLSTVKDLNRIGICAESRVEEKPDGVEIIVRIPSLPST